jgi:DNA-binding IclR family transcriptional regulator
MKTQPMTTPRKPTPMKSPVKSPSKSAQRGIQSVEVGGQLLLALAHHGRPMALKDLSLAANMAAAKAHPYLVSFGKLGLIAQDAESGRYGLGPLAMQLGLISLQQFDPVRLATPLIAELAQTLGHTVGIAVWGNRGPTIVRIEEAPSAVHVNMRHGTVMSLRGTASGLLFAAYLPRDQVLVAVADEHSAELRAAGKSVPAKYRASIDAATEAELAQIRQRGLSRVSGSAVAGVSAMAAPVFTEGGAMVLSLTAIGPGAIFDSTLDGAVATALRRAAAEVSKRLGA